MYIICRLVFSLSHKMRYTVSKLQTRPSVLFVSDAGAAHSVDDFQLCDTDHVRVTPSLVSVMGYHIIRTKMFSVDLLCAIKYSVNVHFYFVLK